MPYREEEGASKARRLSLQLEIESLEHRARDLPYLELRKSELQRELAALPDPSAKPPRIVSPAMWATGALMTLLVLGGGAAIAFQLHAERDFDVQSRQPEDVGVAQPNPRLNIGQANVPERAAPASVPQVAPDAYGISLDFVGAGDSMRGNEGAGVAPLEHWNALLGATGASTGLVDSAGDPIEATKVSWTSGDGWFDVQAYNPDNHMFSGYIEQNGAPDVQGTVTVSVTGLPRIFAAGKYAVIVYSDKLGNPEDQVTRLALTAGSFSQVFYLRDPSLHDYPLSGGTRGYVAATGTSDARSQTPIANCAVFENLSAKDFQIQVSTTARMPNNTGGYLRSPINGAQILPMSTFLKIGLSAKAR